MWNEPWALVGTILTLLIIPLLAYLYQDGKKTLDEKHKELKNDVDEKHKDLKGNVAEMTKELRTVNSRIVKLETWSGLHEDADERRFKKLDEDILRVRG